MLSHIVCTVSFLGMFIHILDTLPYEILRNPTRNLSKSYDLMTISVISAVFTAQFTFPDFVVLIFLESLTDSCTEIHAICYSPVFFALLCLNTVLRILFSDSLNRN